MTRVLLFDTNLIEHQVLESKTSNERYQFAINELKSGICVSIMTLKAFQALFNEGAVHPDDYFVYFCEV